MFRFEEEHNEQPSGHRRHDDPYNPVISEQTIKTDEERVKIRKNLEKLLEEKRIKDEDDFL